MHPATYWCLHYFITLRVGSHPQRPSPHGGSGSGLPTQEPSVVQAVRVTHWLWWGLSGALQKQRRDYKRIRLVFRYRGIHVPRVPRTGSETSNRRSNSNFASSSAGQFDTELSYIIAAAHARQSTLPRTWAHSNRLRAAKNSGSRTRKVMLLLTVA
jgi:hypothetical protein